MKTEYMTERPEWAKFYPIWSWGIQVNKAGYFDERPEVIISATQIAAILWLLSFPLTGLIALWAIPFIIGGWGKVYAHLPIKTGIQDCESAGWGFDIHNNGFWIYTGGAGNFEGGRKTTCFRFPWDLQWVRTSTKLKDGTWFNETHGNRSDWSATQDVIGSHKWLEENKWKETHPYVDKYDGSVVNATISVEQMEWRPKGAMWAWFWAKKREYIQIEFDKEVGAQKGDWKGGVIGCSWDFLPNEAPADALRRMEKERQF